MRPRTVAVTAALVGALFVAAAYVPDVGRGFVKDDAAWVATGAEALRHPASAFAVSSAGYFFRPLVTASFAVDYAAYGAHPLGYGITNLLLFAGSAALIALLFNDLGLTPVATATALLAWTLNPHGISMALLWISGRTSLLMALCSVAAVLAVLRQRYAVAATLLLLALFAKEDAVAVPVIALTCAYAAGRLDRRRAVRAAAWMAAALAVYFALRLRTSAMTPATAPSYYRLLTNPRAIAVNALSYLDRAGTSAAVLALTAAFVYWPLRRAAIRWRLLAVALVWLVAGFAITVLIPVRSDLYAVFPSLGPALASAVVVDACRVNWISSKVSARDRALAVVFAALLLLVPIYRLRNGRFVQPAHVSELVQRQLVADLPSLPPHGLVVFDDLGRASRAESRGRFTSFADAFDGMASDAVQLFTNRPLTAEIVMQPDAPKRPNEVARYAIEDERVVRIW